MTKKVRIRNAALIESRRRFTAAVREQRQHDGHEFWQKMSNGLLDKDTFVSWSLDTPQRVAYSPGGTERGDTRRRRNTTLNRYIQRHLNKEGTIPEMWIQAYSNKLLSSNKLGETFTLLSGDDIVEAYRNNTGGHSCMTGDCAEYVQVYAENDCVKLLVYTSPQGETARCIVWEATDMATDEVVTIADRIYPSDGGPHCEAIARHCRENGWKTRADAIHGGPFRVDLTCENGVWPYMDTFKYAYGGPEESVVTTDSVMIFEKEYGGRTVLEHTNGQYDENAVCSCCEDSCNENDLSRVENDERVCPSCFREYYRYCGLSEEYCHENNMVEVVDIGEVFSEEALERSRRYYRCQDTLDWHRHTKVHDGERYCLESYVRILEEEAENADEDEDEDIADIILDSCPDIARINAELESTTTTTEEN